MGWVRSNAWTWLFSSTHCTNALSGGFKYKPTTSRSFSMKNGSVGNGLTDAAPQTTGLARSLVPIAVLTLVWGCNWPILKLGVTELAPLTFRAYTLPFAALGLLAIAKASGESIRIPRGLWPVVVVLALFNITGWNGLDPVRRAADAGRPQRDPRLHDAGVGHAGRR